MTASQRLVSVAVVVVGISIAGCRKDGGGDRAIKPPPELLTPPKLIQEINRNNNALASLYAQHSFEGDFYDPRSKKMRFLNGSGDLFLLKPRDLLFRAKKDPIGEIFRMGSTQDRFWFVSEEGDKGMWWGHHRNAGKPCVSEMPVRPDLVGEVLGISDINTFLLEAPFPTVRYNSDLRVYMVTWNAPAPDLGHWFIDREIWYTADKPILPVKVILYDRSGQTVLRANLQKHRQVEAPDVAREQWPWVATHYALLFPQTRSTMTITLGDVALRTKTGQPKAGMIRFPEDPDVPAEKVVQIDADCEKEK
jgi:hypothetical protein